MPLTPNFEALTHIGVADLSGSAKISTFGHVFGGSNICAMILSTHLGVFGTGSTFLWNFFDVCTMIFTCWAGFVTKDRRFWTVRGYIGKEDLELSEENCYWIGVRDDRWKKLDEPTESARFVQAVLESSFFLLLRIVSQLSSKPLWDEIPPGKFLRWTVHGGVGSVDYMHLFWKTVPSSGKDSSIFQRTGGWQILLWKQCVIVICISGTFSAG